jgi:hypothetical protein
MKYLKKFNEIFFFMDVLPDDKGFIEEILGNLDEVYDITHITRNPTGFDNVFKFRYKNFEIVVNDVSNIVEYIDSESPSDEKRITSDNAKKLYSEIRDKHQASK